MGPNRSESRATLEADAQRMVRVPRGTSLTTSFEKWSRKMVILGVILLIIGLVAGIPVLTTIGAILIVVGLVLNLVPIGGTRRTYY
jgi:uncharacterized membrane protein HdeD (DUF308 family)